MSETNSSGSEFKPDAPSDPHGDIDDALQELSGQNQDPTGAVSEYFVDLPSRTENHMRSLADLPSGSRGFFGVHLVEGEDGRIMKHPDGAPVRLDELPDSRGGPVPGSNPFDVK